MLRHSTNSTLGGLFWIHIRYFECWGACQLDPEIPTERLDFLFQVGSCHLGRRRCRCGALPSVPGERPVKKAGLWKSIFICSTAVRLEVALDQAFLSMFLCNKPWHKAEYHIEERLPALSLLQHDSHRSHLPFFQHKAEGSALFSPNKRWHGGRH